MCVSCETYEYSGSCGPRCSDHDYQLDLDLSEDGDVFFRCHCGSVKSDEDEEMNDAA